MSKDGYYGDFDSFADEQRAYEQWQNSQESQEPDVVPCRCGNPMYETDVTCGSCDSIPATTKKAPDAKWRKNSY